jgi:hypothetical protein
MMICAHVQVYLLFSESERATVEMSNSAGFVHVRKMSSNLEQESFLTEVQWIKSIGFDAIFYPEVAMTQLCVLVPKPPCAKVLDPSDKNLLLL